MRDITGSFQAEVGHPHDNAARYAFSMTDAHALTHKFGGVWHNGSGQAPCPICQPEGRQNQVARDDSGKCAGISLASRASALGWMVNQLSAPDEQDWNDLLCAQGVAA